MSAWRGSAANRNPRVAAAAGDCAGIGRIDELQRLKLGHSAALAARPPFDLAQGEKSCPDRAYGANCTAALGCVPMSDRCRPNLPSRTALLCAKSHQWMRCWLGLALNL